MKAFGGDSLGRPDQDANYTVADITKYFKKKGIDLGSVTPEPVLVFTNEKVTLNAEGYSGSVVVADKLKEFIRRRAKANPVPPELLASIQQAIYPQ